jgi:3-oxoadipate enol-lactonase
MPHIKLGDVSLHYRVDGPENAPVIVFSNSLGSDLSMWDAQAAALSHDFRVLRYDGRGQGLSSVPAGPYSVEMLSRDVVGLIDGLGLDRVSFCGLSMGGMIGMWLGENAAGRLRKLMLCNASAKLGSPETWKPRMDAVQQSGMAAIVDTTLGRWFTPSFHASSPDQIGRIRNMLLRAPVDGFLGAYAALRDADHRELIARIAAPTLVIAGSKDPGTTPADGRFLAGKIPGAQYVELDAAHLSNVERSTEFNAAIVSFLAAA